MAVQLGRVRAWFLFRFKPAPPSRFFAAQVPFLLGREGAGQCCAELQRHLILAGRDHTLVLSRMCWSSIRPFGVLDPAGSVSVGGMGVERYKPHQCGRLKPPEACERTRELDSVHDLRGTRVASNSRRRVTLTSSLQVVDDLGLVGGFCCAQNAKWSDADIEGGWAVHSPRSGKRGELQVTALVFLIRVGGVLVEPCEMSATGSSLAGVDLRGSCLSLRNRFLDWFNCKVRNWAKENRNFPRAELPLLRYRAHHLIVDFIAHFEFTFSPRAGARRKLHVGSML
jgi:hypothetical protein